MELRRLARTLPAGAQHVPTTQTFMLSGTGPDDAVAWDFSIDGCMRAGEAARIKVPSNWQQQGFGHYQYGYDKGRRAADTGTYRRRFAVPADWQGRAVRVVFDAVMTDTLVRLNSHVVGTGHEGGWNRELDGDFALHDPQAQSVIHPWEAFGGIDTKYNPRYPDLQRRLAEPTLVLPPSSCTACSTAAWARG